MSYTLLQTFYLSDLGIEGRVFQWNDLAVLHRAFFRKKKQTNRSVRGQYQTPSVENREKQSLLIIEEPATHTIL